MTIDMTLRKAAALLSGVVFGVVLISGCAAKPPSPPEQDSVVGALISKEVLPALDPALAAVTSLAVRITYGSMSGVNDSNTKVSAAAFVPKGDPPPDGWPMVAMGHQATGILPQCAPSLSPTLLNESATIVDFVKAGYLVVAPDYQGLGLPATYHPFLDSTTEGYNLIDAMSAVRKVVDDTSDKWIAFGIGQGGQASWAADELVENHGLGLTLVGAVSAAPVADITGLADLAAAGTMNTDQTLALQSFLAALKNAYYDDVNLDDYRRGKAEQNWDALLACDPESSDQRAALAKQIGPDDLRPVSPDAVDRLRRYLQKTTLPQAPTQAPMLVLYGGQDPLIPADWTRRALQGACAMGDVIEIRFQPDKGGANIDVSGAIGWFNDRFAGKPAVNDCGPPAPTEAPLQGNG
jgi:pimeloyl-ACP methyl ester carboxylesterase